MELEQFLLWWEAAQICFLMTSILIIREGISILYVHCKIFLKIIAIKFYDTVTIHGTMKDYAFPHAEVNHITDKH